MMDDANREDDLVVAASFRLPHEAPFAKGLLASYGIDAFLGNENTAALGMHLSHIIGGAKLMVRRTDLPQALELLGSVEEGGTHWPGEEMDAKT